MGAKISKDTYKHYLFGENPLLSDDEYIIRLVEPRVYIRIKSGEGLFTEFDDFFEEIAEVQWLDGYAPDEQTKEKIFTEAWNFLALCERKWEEIDAFKDMHREFDELGDDL